jgi:hypothetical protein
MLPTLAAPLVAAFIGGTLQINRPKGVSHRRLSWGHHAGRVGSRAALVAAPARAGRRRAPVSLGAAIDAE